MKDFWAAVHLYISFVQRKRLWFTCLVMYPDSFTHINSYPFRTHSRSALILLNCLHFLEWSMCSSRRSAFACVVVSLCLESPFARSHFRTLSSCSTPSKPLGNFPDPPQGLQQHLQLSRVWSCSVRMYDCQAQGFFPETRPQHFEFYVNRLTPCVSSWQSPTSGWFHHISLLLIFDLHFFY